MSRPFHVRVWPLPSWLEWHPLLGPGQWTTNARPDGSVEAKAVLERDAAADLTARLRGVGIGGSLLHIEVSPSLHRKELRKANLEESRRYRQGSQGFSKRSSQLDSEGKVSLTPETLALELGERAQGRHVIDACTGAGGNAIGFARAGCRVTAVEIDPRRLAMAKHNAKLYGVADRIDFVGGDATLIVPSTKADLLFIDPPWGERYNKERVILQDLAPAEALLRSADHIPTCWLKVPPSFDSSTLPSYQASAFYGVGLGDNRRVKFLLLEGIQADQT